MWVVVLLSLLREAVSQADAAAAKYINPCWGRPRTNGNCLGKAVVYPHLPTHSRWLPTHRPLNGRERETAAERDRQRHSLEAFPPPIVDACAHRWGQKNNNSRGIYLNVVRKVCFQA